MRYLCSIFFVGILRDRALYGFLVLGAMFLAIPAISALSMRQAAALSLSLSFSVTSFLLLLLAIFFSSFAIWRDMERRYTYSVLALPVSRSRYVMAKFVANVAIVLLSGLLFAVLTFVAVSYTATIYPPQRALVWGNITIALLFNVLQYVLLAACGLLFSTVSTSFFLPVFGTIIIFLCGSMSQDVYNYLSSSAATDVPDFVKQIFSLFYYIVPNFSAFDFKYAAIYSVPIAWQDLWLTFGYFAAYLAVVLFLACFFFNRRELR